MSSLDPEWACTPHGTFDANSSGNDWVDCLKCMRSYETYIDELMRNKSYKEYGE